MKRLALLFLSIICAFCCVFAFTACTDSDEGTQDSSSLSDSGVESTISHTHKYGEWKSNEDKHWKECTATGYCDAQKIEADHVDNDKNQACDICGYKTHNHNYGEWQSNEAKHWKECTATGYCDAQKIEANHVDNDNNLVCDICDYKMHVHNYGEWQSNETKHWKECNGEGECDAKKIGERNHIDNDKDALCDICHFNMHVHEYSEWKMNKTHHWKECTSAGECDAKEIDRAEHVFSGENGVCNICKVVFGTLTYKEIKKNSVVVAYSVEKVLQKDASYVDIPKEHNGKPITSIMSNAFSNCTSLREVIIHDGVTSIGGSFDNCTSLTNVTMPNTLTTIGARTFLNCTSLTEITIPDSVTTINSEAFDGCTSLAKVSIGNGVTSIGAQAFDNCNALKFNEYNNALYLGNDENPYFALIKPKDTSITSCDIYNTTKLIAVQAFAYCTSLTNVTIPNSVAYMDSMAFYRCEKLNLYEYDNALYLGNKENPCLVLLKAKDTSITSCNINQNTRFILYNAFYQCENLKSIVIPDNVTQFATAFEDCSNLESVTLPKNLTNISYNAFYSCEKLKNITIPESVTSIGGEAFFGCRSLTEINIPKGVTSIGVRAFLGAGITRITLPEGVSVVRGLFSNCTYLTDVTISDSATYIGEEAFYYCTNLKSITIPKAVNYIDDRAFEKCENLTSIVIPNSVTSIYGYAFDACEKLQNVYFFGTEEEWNKISISSGNDYLTNATKYFYSETEPTKEGNYWHYVNGVATLWA